MSIQSFMKFLSKHSWVVCMCTNRHQWWSCFHCQWCHQCSQENNEWNSNKGNSGIHGHCSNVMMSQHVCRFFGNTVIIVPPYDYEHLSYWYYKMQEIKKHEFGVVSSAVNIQTKFWVITWVQTDISFEDVTIGNDIIMATKGIINATMVTKTMVHKVTVHAQKIMDNINIPSHKSDDLSC
jgi:hypothetical protein